MAADHDITALLERWRTGSPAAGDALLERVYLELRKVASAYLRLERRGRDHTLEPTALVHEAYLRLLPQRAVPWENRAHFFGIAARMMRRVLVDHARRRQSRRGPDAVVTSISGIGAITVSTSSVDVLDLHRALLELAEIAPRQVSIVEQRYFAGMTVPEIAEAMRLSPATVKREWTAAKFWLRRRMRRSESA